MNKIILPAQYLIETPLAQLYTNTINGFDTPRGQSAGRVQVVRKVFVPAPNNGIVTIKATTRSSANTYTTRMSFDDITYLDDEEAQGNNYVFQASDGQDYIIEPVNYNGGDVKVSCSCLDFYYRFSVWNDGDNSLLGSPPPPYIKKTDTHGPVNPNRIPGLCKHLIALTDELRRERFLR